MQLFFQEHDKKLQESFHDLSSIIDGDSNRRQTVTLNEWNNWLLQESVISETEDYLFLKNPEYKDWKVRFFNYSDGNDFITLEQTKALEENSWKKYLVDELFDLSSKLL